MNKKTTSNMAIRELEYNAEFKGGVGLMFSKVILLLILLAYEIGYLAYFAPFTSLFMPFIVLSFVLIFLKTIPKVHYFFNCKDKIELFNDHLYIKKKNESININFFEIEKIHIDIFGTLKFYYGKNKKYYIFPELQEAETILDKIIKNRPNLIPSDIYEQKRNLLVSIEKEKIKEDKASFGGFDFSWTIGILILIYICGIEVSNIFEDYKTYSNLLIQNIFILFLGLILFYEIVRTAYKYKIYNSDQQHFSSLHSSEDKLIKLLNIPYICFCLLTLSIFVTSGWYHVSLVKVHNNDIQKYISIDFSPINFNQLSNEKIVFKSDNKNVIGQITNDNSTKKRGISNIENTKGIYLKFENKVVFVKEKNILGKVSKK